MSNTPRRISHQDLESFFSNCTQNWKKSSSQSNFRNYQIMDIQKIWELVASHYLAAHSFPQQIKKDTLWVQTDHSIFAQSVKMLEKKILERIYNESGILLKKVYTIVGTNTYNFLHKQQIQSEKDILKRGDIMSSHNKLSTREVQFNSFIQKISSLT